MDEVIPRVVCDISYLIHRLKRDPSLDIGRLSYELTQDEWRELCRYVEQWQFIPDVPIMGAMTEMKFMGLRVWRKSQDGEGHRE